LRGRRYLARVIVHVHATRKQYAVRPDAHLFELFLQPRGGRVARFIPVISNPDVADAVFLESGFVVFGESADSVAGRDISETGAPERQRVDQRFAQDDLLRAFERLLVPHAAVRARQVEVQRRALAQSLSDLAAVHAEDVA